MGHRGHIKDGIFGRLLGQQRMRLLTALLSSSLITGIMAAKFVLSLNMKEECTMPSMRSLATIAVARRQSVAEFDLIGTTGESGNAQGMPEKDQHLHFEIRTTASPGRGLGGRISPLRIFGRCPLVSAELQFPPMVITAGR